MQIRIDYLLWCIFQMVLYVVVEFLVEEGAVGIVPDNRIEKDGQVCHDPQSNVFKIMFSVKC